MTETQLVVAQPHNHQPQPLTAFASESSFEAAQRMAKALCSSNLVPASFQGQQNIGSALIALEIAQRLQASPLMVMQNLNVIHGRPAWSSQFIIAALNSCGRFSPLRFDVRSLGKKSVSYTEWVGEKPNRRKVEKSAEIDNIECVAWATDKTGERLDGPAVTIEMAVKEGWWSKSDSKWQTMPELMLRYRAAAFFGRLYAPDVLMGMQTIEEVADVNPTAPKTASVNEVLDAPVLVETTPAPAPEQPAPKPQRQSRKESKTAITAEPEPTPNPQPVTAEETPKGESNAEPAASPVGDDIFG